MPPGLVAVVAIVPALGQRLEERRRAHRIHVRGQRSAAGTLDHRGERCFGRHGHARLLRRADGDDAVAIGHPVAGEAVDVGEGNLRHEAAHERVLVGDAGNRLLLHEVADELVGERIRRVLVIGRGELLEDAHDRQPVAIELGLREAELRHAVGLVEERRQALLDAAVGNERAEGRDLGRLHEDRAVRLRVEERRVRLLGDLREPGREQAGKRALDRLLAIGADRRLIARRHRRRNAHRRCRGFRIGGDGVARARMVGHRRRSAAAAATPPPGSCRSAP